MLETPYQFARRQGLTFTIRTDQNRPKGEASLVLLLGPSKETRVDFEADRVPGQQWRYKLTSSSPWAANSLVPRLESTELSVDLRLLEDGKVMELDAVAGLSGDKVKLTGRVSLIPSQRELDVSLAVPNMNPLRFLGRISSQPPTYTLTTRVDWGTTTLTIESTAKYVSSDNFEVSLVVNSPELDINNREVRVSNKLQKKERVVELSVLHASTVVASIKSVYDRKETSTGTEVTGRAEVAVSELDMSGSVNYVAEHRRVDSAGEKGVEYKLNVDLAAGSMSIEKLNGKLKWTNKEMSGSIGACGVALCQDGSFAYRRTANGVEAHILRKNREGDSDLTSGLRFKHATTTDRVEQSLEVLK